MTKSKIEWTDRTWNPVRGCSLVSEGCRNCYAMKQAHRFSGKGLPFEGLTKNTNSGVKWTGDIRLVPDSLDEPFKWKKPSMVFVNSMSDLFHEDVPFEFIDKVLDTIMQTPWHTYQVLTKRTERMMDYLSYSEEKNGIVLSFNRNLWLGVSVEDQKTADQRIPKLLEAPAKIKWISAEPLLGSIDLVKYLDAPWELPQTQLAWVVVGGESGHGARPMHPDWVRTIRDQCKESQTPFFFKQWGEYLPFQPTAQPPFYARCSDNAEFDSHGMNFIDPMTAEPGKWLGYQWYDHDVATMMDFETNSELLTTYLKVGKSKSGNYLDGRQHLEFPKSKTVNPQI